MPWPRPLLPAVLALAAAALLGAAPRVALAVGAPGASAAREPGPSDARRLAARAELDALAPRIEALKREVAAGRTSERELTPLLARAQELADLLATAAGERGAPAPLFAVQPDAEELRERADALRDQADRIARALSEVERQLASARRQAHLAERLGQVGGAGELFAESAPRRALTSPGAAASGGAQPTSSTPPGTTQVPGGAASPPPAGPSTSSAPPPSTPGTASSPSMVVADPSLPELAPRAGERRASVSELQRRRSDLAASLAALRGRAEALDAEARAAETAR